MIDSPAAQEGCLLYASMLTNPRVGNIRELQMLFREEIMNIQCQMMPKPLYRNCVSALNLLTHANHVILASRFRGNSNSIFEGKGLVGFVA